jgi:2-octaprenylphenol hydroxylase
MTRVDLIIQGAGIVGSTLALLAAQALPECKIVLVDQAPLLKASDAPAASDAAPVMDQWSPRVSALSLASQAILTAIDAWPSTARLAPFQRMRVRPFTQTAELLLDARDIAAPYLGVIVENQILQQVLHARLHQHPQIQVINGVSIEAIVQHADHVQVQIGEHHYAAQLLVGADGAQSRVQQLVVFAQQRLDYQHSALVTHLHTTRPHDWQAQQIFLETGPIAFLPLTTRTQVADCPPAGAAEQFVSLVWSGPSAQQQALMQLSDEDFLLQVNRLLPENLGAALHCQQRLVFPLTRHSVENVVNHRVVLVGDAAQRMHPLAGQGLNIGLLDAACLVAHMGLGDDLANTSALQSYQMARRAQVKPLTEVIHQLHRHYRPQTPWWQQLLRQQGFQWAAHSPVFKLLMNQMANAQSYLPATYQPYWPGVRR